MRKINILLIALGALISASGLTKNEKALPAFDQIKNFRFVSEELASSGMLELDQYSSIQDYGFRHVINLIPGNQIKERRHVESLGLSYEQIPVDWNQPKQEDFAQFVKLMKSYDQDKVYVHCQLNWRASAFVYLYRVTQLGVSPETAKKDMLAIWQPEGTWLQFIKATQAAYEKRRPFK